VKSETWNRKWSSHVEEVPGQVGKLFVAAGFLRAASTIRVDYESASCSPLPTAGAFGLLPEPENRYKEFAISIVTNVVIVVLLILLTTAIHREARANRMGGTSKVLQSDQLDLAVHSPV
jgi:hypothetical protein